MPVLPPGMSPTVAAYSHNGPGGVLRTEVAGGAARYAQQYGRGTQQFNVTLILDPLKFSVWIAFFHHIILKGARTFDMPLDSGFGTELHAVNIVPGTYSATRTGGTAMVVAFVVEAESKAYDMSAADAAALIEFYSNYGSDTQPLLDRLAQFANSDTNVLDFQ